MGVGVGVGGRRGSPGGLLALVDFFFKTGTVGGWVHGDALARQALWFSRAEGRPAAVGVGGVQNSQFTGQSPAVLVLWEEGCVCVSAWAWASKRRPAATVSLCGGSRTQDAAAGSTPQQQQQQQRSGEIRGWMDGDGWVDGRIGIRMGDGWGLRVWLAQVQSAGWATTCFLGSGRAANGKRARGLEWHPMPADSIGL